MQTIVKEQYKDEVLKFDNGLNSYTFIICGQTVERSYEDRNVYFQISKDEGWLKAEDAIELGTKLIEHGKRAMLANMYNHQLIHYTNRLSKDAYAKKINKVIIKKIQDNAPNYGSGYGIFEIQTKGNDEYKFEKVLYEGISSEESDTIKLKKYLDTLNIEVEIIDNFVDDRKLDNEAKIKSIDSILEKNEDIKDIFINDYGISDTTYDDKKHHSYEFTIYLDKQTLYFEILLTPQEFKAKYENLQTIKRATV